MTAAAFASPTSPPRAGPEPVYNLQVHGEHVYQVGSDGLLVHNKTPSSAAAVHPGLAAAESNVASQASVLRALRAADTPEAHAVAKLIKRNKVKLEILDTDPYLQGAAGRKPWGSNVIQVYRDKAGATRQAAGISVHETRHWLQKITPSTYRRIHEFEAYQFQRRAGFLSMTDDEIWSLINMSPLYKNVPK